MRYIAGFFIAAAVAMYSNATNAAIAHVASTSAGSTGGATVTTSSIDTTGANLIVVAVSYYSDGVVPTLSDSKGNTWTGLTERSLSASSSVRLFYCVAPTVGSGHTFTAARLNSYPTVSVSAFSGAAASPYDQESGAVVGTTSTSYQPGSITPSENNCVLVTGIANGGTSNTIDSSFNATSTGNSGSNHVGGGIAYKIQTTAGAENPTWSWTTSSSRASAMASFKAAAGAAALDPLSTTIPGSSADPLTGTIPGL